MYNRLKVSSFHVLLLVVLSLLAGCASADVSVAGADVVANLSGEVDQGFARAYEPIDFQFPLDHGPHPEYQTEWWYFTGNLVDDAENPYGFQFTIFRSALTPDSPERESSFATNQVYMAHVAMTNGEDRRHVSFERFSRGDEQLAGASGEPAFEVWLEDWHVSEKESGVWSMQAKEFTEDGEAFALDLQLSETRAPIYHGQSGLSQKGPEPGNASYYYSLVGLETSGVLTWDGQEMPVNGVSWMDHEFGTSALSENAVGWDWFSTQLNNGDVLMLAQIRTEEGGLIDEMKGTLAKSNGETITLNVDDFQLDVLDEWTSSRTDITYPSGWQVAILDQAIELEFTPVIRDQEMDVSYTYWEGAVDVAGAVDGEPVNGVGYVELTGYGAAEPERRFQR